MTARARSLIAAMRVLVLAFGTASLWLARDGMNPDGVAYLDASDVYLSGGWPASGSGYWSPLYPTLLALGRLIGGTEPSRELPIAQAINLVLFVLAFASLEFFIRVMRRAGIRTDRQDAPNDLPWRVLMYVLFAVASVGWIRTWLLTPDMLVAAVVLVAGGLSVRIASGGAGSPSSIALGALLGFGYLTKAALLPFGVIVLATLAFSLWRRRQPRWVPQTTIAAVVFVVIALPQVVYASRLKGAPTFGDVGRLSYLWYIADVPGPVSAAFALPARLPSPDSAGQTLTPLVADAGSPPAVYDIDAPIPGTLPIWYDAGYWYRGVVAPFQPLRVVRAIVRHGRVFLEVLGFLIVGGVAAVFAGSRSRRDVAAMSPAWALIVPALAAFAMYTLVLVQTRYIAPFVVLLVAGLVPPWASDDLSRRLRAGLVVGALAFLPLVAHQIRVDTAYWRGSAHHRTDVVRALSARGVAPDARVGFIGDAYEALWGREARVRFVTLLPRREAGRFWSLDAAARARVLDGMGARTQAIVAERPPAGVNTDGWEALPAPHPAGPELMIATGAAAGATGVARR